MLGEEAFDYGDNMYTLAIGLMGFGNFSNMSALVSSIWSLEEFDGCFLDGNSRESTQTRVRPSLTGPNSPRSLFGHATLPDGSRLPIETFVMPADETDFQSIARDRIDLKIPLWSLERFYPVDFYPDNDAPSRPWRQKVEDWFGSVGCRVFRLTPFSWAAIKLNVGTDFEERRIELGVGGIPDLRPYGILWPEENELAYYPTTKW